MDSSQKTKQKQKTIEETLWDSANKLRGSVEPSEYKHVVLSLLFLKFASDKYEERRQELIAEGQSDYMDMVEFYTMKNIFYLPEEARWSFIKDHAKENDLAVKIDSVLVIDEKDNKLLKVDLPNNYILRHGLDVSKLTVFTDRTNNINTFADKREQYISYSTMHLQRRVKYEQ